VKFVSSLSFGRQSGSGKTQTERRGLAASWRKDTLSITHFDRDHAVGRPHEIVQDGERWQFVGRAVGERYRYELRRLLSTQAEVDPSAEDHAGGDAMATANLCHADAGLLRLLHDRSLLPVAEATPI
jgi:hypothetical protein